MKLLSPELILYKCSNEYCEHEFFPDDAVWELVYDARGDRFSQDEYEPRCPICGEECFELDNIEDSEMFKEKGVTNNA